MYAQLQVHCLPFKETLHTLLGYLFVLVLTINSHSQCTRRKWNQQPSAF